MKKSNGKKHNRTVKKAGSRRPPETVSKNNVIQYPSRNIKISPEGGKTHKKKLKQKPDANSQRKSRKTIRKQRNKHIFATTVLLIILLLICIFISWKVLFVVRDVEVVGSEKYTEDEVLAYCAIPMERNIFEIDTEMLSESLPDEFTYIDSAKVQRKLPDKILITITDSIPTYYSEVINEEISTFIIYSQNFKELTKQSAASEGLINISVNLENEGSKEVLLQVIEKLETNGYDKFTKIAVTDSGEVTITYDGRIEVKLGTMLDMDYKLKMSYRVLREELSETDKGILDSTQGGSAVFKPFV